MIIQKGKAYVTKGGVCPISKETRDSVYVELMFNTGGQAHPWVGMVNGKMGCWGNDGRYALGLPHMDLKDI